MGIVMRVCVYIVVVQHATIQYSTERKKKMFLSTNTLIESFLCFLFYPTYPPTYHFYSSLLGPVPLTPPFCG